MISKKYVESGFDYMKYDEPYNTFMEDTQDLLDQIAVLDAPFNQLPILAEFGFYESEEAKEARHKGVVEKLGDLVKEVFAKIQKFFSDLMDKIKNIGFKNKSVLDKIEAFKKKHPDEASKLKIYLDEGKIDHVEVMRSIKDLEDAYNAIDEAAKKSDADRGELQKKWDAAKDKFKKSEKTWAAVGTAAVAIGTIGTLLYNLTRTRETINNINNTNARRKADFEKRLLDNNTSETHKSAYNSNDSATTFRLRKTTEYNQMVGGALSKIISWTSKVGAAASHAIDRHQLAKEPTFSGRHEMLKNRRDDRNKEIEKINLNNDVHRARG